MHRHRLLYAALAASLLCAAPVAAGIGSGIAGAIGECLQQSGGPDTGTLQGNADTVDWFHASDVRTPDTLLALDGAGHFPVAAFADNSIPGGKLVPGAVTAGRLGNNSVTTNKISDGQVMAADLAAGAVTRTKIANGAVTRTKIADQAVTGGKLAYGAVTAGRLADNSVTTSKIVNQAITSDKLALGAVTAGRLADNSVTTSKIVSGTIRGDDVAIPLVVGGSRDGYLIGCLNSSNESTSSGICGYSLATSGHTRGVVGGCESTAGRAVYGVAKALTGYNFGVFGESASTDGTGVYGKVSASTGVTRGVSGISASNTGRGVWGAATHSSGTNYGVLGTTWSSNGYGVYSEGNAYVDGDLTITGDKGGYVTDIILNGGDEPLFPGDLVDIMSYAEPVLGEIPVAVLLKTVEAESTAVLGPIDCSVRVAPNEAAELGPGSPREPAPYHVHRADGVIAPGGYGKVVTLGLFKRINVDASYGPIYPGDLLVSSPTPGYAMACDDPMVGTVVGKALGALESGIGEMPVFVSSR